MGESNKIRGHQVGVMRPVGKFPNLTDRRFHNAVSRFQDWTANVTEPKVKFCGRFCRINLLFDRSPVTVMGLPPKDPNDDEEEEEDEQDEPDKEEEPTVVREPDEC